MVAPKPDHPNYYRKADLERVDHRPPSTPWREAVTTFQPGGFLHPAKPKNLESLGLPSAHAWSPLDEDWKLPDNWKEIVIDGMRERLAASRTLLLFMDTCVRCGACAERCPFFIGTGDPKNMPVLRAELLRSVYRRYFTTEHQDPLFRTIPRQMLHASRITFPHPTAGEHIHAQAPIPADYRAVLRQLGLA